MSEPAPAWLPVPVLEPLVLEPLEAAPVTVLSPGRPLVAELRPGTTLDTEDRPGMAPDTEDRPGSMLVALLAALAASRAPVTGELAPVGPDDTPPAGLDEPQGAPSAPATAASTRPGHGQAGQVTEDAGGGRSAGPLGDPGQRGRRQDVDARYRLRERRRGDTNREDAPGCEWRTVVS
jgi:hypothetical protein